MSTNIFQARLYRTFRKATLTFLGSAAFLWLAVASATAAVILPPPSDEVRVSVNGSTVVDFFINESEEGQTFSIPVPRTIIELTEPGTTGQTQISDRLIIEPYTIRFWSDSEGPVTPPRTIPGVGRRSGGGAGAEVGARGRFVYAGRAQGATRV